MKQFKIVYVLLNKITSHTYFASVQVNNFAHLYLLLSLKNISIQRNCSIFNFRSILKRLIIIKQYWLHHTPNKHSNPFIYLEMGRWCSCVLFKSPLLWLTLSWKQLLSVVGLDLLYKVSNSVVITTNFHRRRRLFIRVFKSLHHSSCNM